MPMVTVKLIEGVFTPEQKQEMIRKITDTMVEIEGENLRPVTWVLVEEVCSGDWGIGGNGRSGWTSGLSGMARCPPRTSAVSCWRAPSRESARRSAPG
jgi:4-oxalocrotonate tautomerase